MKSYPMVEVLWLDAIEAMTDGWMEIKDLKNKPMPSKSLGYLVKDTKDAITLVALQNENHVALGITIPRAMITEIRTLSHQKS